MASMCREHGHVTVEKGREEPHCDVRKAHKEEKNKKDIYSHVYRYLFYIFCSHGIYNIKKRKARSIITLSGIISQDKSTLNYVLLVVLT